MSILGSELNSDRQYQRADFSGDAYQKFQTEALGCGRPWSVSEISQSSAYTTADVVSGQCVASSSRNLDNLNYYGSGARNQGFGPWIQKTSLTLPIPDLARQTQTLALLPLYARFNV